VTWRPKNFHGSYNPGPGLHEARLCGVSAATTKVKRLPMITLKFEVDGFPAEFALIFGAHPVLDHRNGKIIEDLHKLAGMEVEDDPDWQSLVENLKDRLVLIDVHEDTKRERNELHGVERHASRIAIHRGWKRQGGTSTETTPEPETDLNDYDPGQSELKTDDDL